ncbi:MAG: hypothetical protein WCQ47_02730, partial [bacterium]
STKNYIVTATIAASSDKNITAFSVSNQIGSTVITNTSATTGSIAVTVPYGTSITNLVATFSTTGVSVAIGSVPQVSGVTTNSFTSPQTYTVTAADGSTKNYIVTATIAASSDKNITSFTVPNQTGSTGIADISSTEGTIAITVPHGTDVTKLVATFSTTGASVAISGTPQISGITSNNFTNPKTYTVTAEDGTTKTYIVTVAIAVSSDKNITAFTFPNQVGASVITDTSSTQGTITAKATYGTDLTKLIATFTITGLSVSIGSTPQVSGTTINNFTSSQTYTVTAEDGSTKSYLVTVTVETTPVITSFTFPNTQRGTTVLRSVITNTSATEGTIDVQVVFYTTDFTKLIADFTTAGASVTVGGVPQVSGVTPNNFTNPIKYTVTASDGKTRNYRVTITVSKNIVSTIDTSTVKGVVVYQGSPNQYLQNVIPGSVTIDAIRASDTSNATCFITSFPLSDASTGATIKVVKYPANGDISNFETAKPYANEPIANNDFFLIKVIAEESVSVGSDYYRYYYKIVVTVTPKSERVIGDCYQGGKIIYILQPDDPGYSKETQHGLIVSSSDQSGSASWGCYTKILSGADGTAIGTGSKNTDNIISGCSTDGIAAKLARAYDGGGYKDWYLPSKDELNKIYLNKSVMDNAYCLYYWSSSESDVNYLAWIQMFDKDYADPAGTQRYENKNSTMCCVRAVRSY